MNFLTRLLHREKNKPSSCFQWNIADSGLRFSFPVSWNKERFQGGLATYQYLALQQLLETGDAEQDKNGIYVESEVLCRLDEETRTILNLPQAWPGHFKLEIQDLTTSNDFSLSLRPQRSTGRRHCSAVSLEGPFLVVEGKSYLPDAVQWLALEAVARHAALPREKRVEAANLRAVLALQEACRQGLSLERHHFSDLTIEIPDNVGVSAIENSDGSLQLIPDFGLGLSPDAIEKRLGQIEGKTKNAVLKVGKKLILLDERRLLAAHEILSTQISARDRRQFFKTPGAYLDASLVSLDTGFSLRVHGMTIFQKAYFGQTETESLLWFGNGDNAEQDIFLLENCLQLVEDKTDFYELQKIVEEAVINGQDIVQFKDKKIILPGNSGETTLALEKIRKALQSAQESTSQSESKRPPEEQKLQTIVNIDLNDSHVAENLLTGKAPFQNYEGDLHKEELAYILTKYQEEGARWILGLMLSSHGDEKDCYRGGLLADDMGLGKTFMALAALNVYRHMTKDTGTEKPLLAVMPVVLLENWRQEIEKVFKLPPFRANDLIILNTCADLQQFRKEGAQRETALVRGKELPPDNQIRYSLKIGPVYGTGRLDKPGRLVLTNYDTLRDYQFSLCLVDWGCVIFDEAQMIKNPNALISRAAKGLKADFRLAMTGTPVENSLTDFWSIYDTVKPGLLGSFQDFRRRYVSPIKESPHGGKRDAVRLDIGRKLRQKAGPFMLRRTKEENLSGLPKKIVHDGMEEGRYCAVMEGRQLETYNAIISSVVAAKQSGDPALVQKAILPGLRKLQTASLHPAFSGGGEPIRCDPSASREDILATLNQSAKLVLLLKILDEIKERQEKVIIFVINRTLQRYLSYALSKLYGLLVFTVNGDTASVSKKTGRGKECRMELIRRFEAKEGFNIICMSPLAAGVGLTVVGANNVIHLERHWNPAKEAQATDRVYRIGATRDVHVYIPILKHPDPEKQSFDVNLNSLLRRKTALKDAVVTEAPVHSNDFNIKAVFGTELLEKRIQPEYLKGLKWEEFEALIALLAKEEWGGPVYLTSRSGDHGADVFVDGSRKVIIQCKVSSKPFSDTGAVDEPSNARKEYFRHVHSQCDKLILAVNAPSVESSVRSLANMQGVSIWDRDVLERLLKKHSIPYAGIEEMLAEPRLDF